MTTHRDSQKKRLRDSLREVWEDTTRAHRALMRRPPYDDYLQHGRYTR